LASAIIFSTAFEYPAPVVLFAAAGPDPRTVWPLIERARLNTFGQGTLSREHLLEPVNWRAAGQE
jgi:hypothetical protein